MIKVETVLVNLGSSQDIMEEAEQQINTFLEFKVSELIDIKQSITADGRLILYTIIYKPK